MKILIKDVTGLFNSGNLEIINDFLVQNTINYVQFNYSSATNSAKIEAELFTDIFAFNQFGIIETQE